VATAFAVYHAVTIAPDVRALVVGYDLVLLVLCFAIHAICRRSRLSPRAFHAVACALSLVTSRHQARKLFVELEREQKQTRAFEVEYGQLQLEQSTWAAPGRIEKVAREQLRMQLPGPARIQAIDGSTR